MALFRFAPDTDPVNELLRLQQEVDRAFERPFFGYGLSNRGVYPPVNVFRENDHVVVRAEVPGVAPDAIQIEADHNTLTIRGERAPRVPEGGSFHRRERNRGAFSRSIELPEDLDLGAAEATCKHGMLTVRIPRKEEAKPRQIAVQAA